MRPQIATLREPTTNAYLNCIDYRVNRTGLVVNTINTDEYHTGPGIHEYEYIQLSGFMNMNTYGARYS